MLNTRGSLATRGVDCDDVCHIVSGAIIIMFNTRGSLATQTDYQHMKFSNPSINLVIHHIGPTSIY